MPVNSQIFASLATIYSIYSNTNDQNLFLKQNRKHIKILTDSLWEQIVSNLFKIHPRNHTDAHFILNKEKHKLTSPEDLRVAEALLDVLRNYDILIDKNYIDAVKKVDLLLTKSLKNLCINLAHHPAHKQYGYAIKLSKLLMEPSQ